nr:hypothetical protein [Entomoplasma sp. MP1]
MVEWLKTFHTGYPLVDGHGNFGSIDSDGSCYALYWQGKAVSFHY